jgi:hypothetical protein
MAPSARRVSVPGIAQEQQTGEGDLEVGEPE